MPRDEIGARTMRNHPLSQERMMRGRTSSAPTGFSVCRWTFSMVSARCGVKAASRCAKSLSRWTHRLPVLERPVDQFKHPRRHRRGCQKAEASPRIAQDERRHHDSGDEDRAEVADQVSPAEEESGGEDGAARNPRVRAPGVEAAEDEEEKAGGEGRRRGGVREEKARVKEKIRVESRHERGGGREGLGPGRGPASSRRRP